MSQRTGIRYQGSEARRRALAAKALRLSRDGLLPKKIGQALGVTTSEARTLISEGAHLERVKESRLREPEQILLRILLERDNAPSMTRARAVDNQADRSGGWCARTCKRLQKWGWVNYACNGYISLMVPGRCAAELLAASERTLP